MMNSAVFATLCIVLSQGVIFLDSQLPTLNQTTQTSYKQKR